MASRESVWLEHGAKVLAVNAKDVELRLSSTSGGLFTVLARQAIRNGGVVFGVVCDFPEGSVHFSSARTMDELEPMRKSKYVQADVEGVFPEVKRCLESTNVPVVFCGTPCQVAGLLHYLGGGQANLLTIDIICHAVPSPLSWRAYLRSQEKSVQSVEFRSKARGWKAYAMSMRTADGTELCSRRKGYAYLWGFLRGLFNRPSCDACAFRKGASGSDITIGDFWGIGNTHPEMDDDRGTSLAIVHTQNGRAAFEAVADSVVWCESTVDEAVRHNPSLVADVDPHPSRGEFFLAIRSGQDFILVVKRLLRMSIVDRCLYRIKSMFANRK